MILERLVLHNFGPYLDRHEIELTPKSAKRPVILLGGMNGGGKTTFLTALQLVLHGRQSDVWRSSSSSYDAYLRQRIHKAADPQEGAGIELHFRSSVQGEEHEYRLCRYWRLAGTSVRESLDVIRNGDLDAVLAENWDEWVEEFIPARVAPLFFFDGEKVEELADHAKSAKILQAAVHSLLGLDIVDQLKSDLEIIERRKRKSYQPEAGNATIVEKERLATQRVADLTQGRSDKTQEKASLTSQRDMLLRQLQHLEAKLSSEGGNLFEQRHELEAAREEAARAASDIEDALRESAAGALPMAMLTPLLEQVEKEARRTQHGTVQSSILEVLSERDTELLTRLRDLGPSKTVVAGLEEFLRMDRDARAAEAPPGPPILDSSGLTRLHALQVHVLPSDLVRTRTSLRKLSERELEVQGLERRLAGLPDEEKILPLLRQRDDLRAELEQTSKKLMDAEEALRIGSTELERAEKELAARQQELAETMLDSEDTGRLLRYSSRARETLAKFRQRVLAAHVQKIEGLALECFATLMRKQRLIQELRIDPHTFEVALYGQGGQLSESDGVSEEAPSRVRISTHFLSAGERQLLAIALLWGLGRASGRPLPTVIDTPLGRLDSSHRKNLVERYFPHASHQVVLLSTDEEIDERFFHALQPHISRSYLLDFDDRKQVTTVKNGYFWETA